ARPHGGQRRRHDREHDRDCRKAVQAPALVTGCGSMAVGDHPSEERRRIAMSIARSPAAIIKTAIDARSRVLAPVKASGPVAPPLDTPVVTGAPVVTPPLFA